MKGMIKYFRMIVAMACIATVNAQGIQSANELPEHYPAWVRDAVFYQIFPERFRNGTPANDPDVQSLLGSYPHDIKSPWNISPWTSDWYERQPWEQKNGKGFFYNAQRRRYGGDLQGIMAKLDYLRELGINAIYLNPVFESPSLHKYDAATYIHIDDNFGPDPERDRRIRAGENPADPQSWRWTTADELFLEFLKEAHKRDIRVILDGVFNHVGIRHWAFLDVRRKGPDSEYADWFHIRSWDDPATPEDEFDYAGWAGVRELPELKENEQGLIPPVKNHIFAVVHRWMDPNGDGDPSDGIDGWRLDVAEKIDHDFWKDFRRYVKAINPEAYITGEIFWEDWENNQLLDPEPWLRGDQFDGVMNYRWSAAVTRYFIDEKEKITASQLFERLEQQDRSYPRRTSYTLLNLMDSHDTDRLASNIVNPDLFYDKRVGVHDNPDYDVRKPNKDEWRLLRLIALFQMTNPGAPMVYYGTEAGMWGADDPDCRKPMVWPDMEYEPERANVSLTPRPVDTVAFDSTLYQYYKNLINLRRAEPALRRGTFKAVLADDERDGLAYLREYDGQQILVIFNNGRQKHTLNVRAENGSWKDLLNGKTYKARKGELQILIAKREGRILKLEQ